MSQSLPAPDEDVVRQLGDRMRILFGLGERSYRLRTRVVQRIGGEYHGYAWQAQLFDDGEPGSPTPEEAPPVATVERFLGKKYSIGASRISSYLDDASMQVVEHLDHKLPEKGLTFEELDPDVLMKTLALELPPLPFRIIKRASNAVAELPPVPAEASCIKTCLELMPREKGHFDHAIDALHDAAKQLHTLYNHMHRNFEIVPRDKNGEPVFPVTESTGVVPRRFRARPPKPANIDMKKYERQLRENDAHSPETIAQLLDNMRDYVKHRQNIRHGMEDQLNGYGKKEKNLYSQLNSMVEDLHKANTAYTQARVYFDAGDMPGKTHVILVMKLAPDGSDEKDVVTERKEIQLTAPPEIRKMQAEKLVSEARGHMQRALERMTEIIENRAHYSGQLMRSLDAGPGAAHTTLLRVADTQEKCWKNIDASCAHLVEACQAPHLDVALPDAVAHHKQTISHSSHPLLRR